MSINLAAVSAPILEVNGLTVTFDNAPPALCDISFSLHSNEVLGIVGETGAGKSLLARAIINLLPKGGRFVSGDLKFRGTSIAAMAPEALRKLRGGAISLIGTNAKELLDPVTPVGRQIARVAQAHKPLSSNEAQKLAVSLLEEVGITNPALRAKAFPHELSGGMAQRIVIAMALAADPQVVLADDATLGLDATVQAQVLENLVKRARDRNIGVMLITHDLGIIRQYCDRVAIMRQGLIVEVNYVKTFFQKPDHAYSRDLLEAGKARPTLRRPEIRDEHLNLLDVRDLTMHFPSHDAGKVIKAVDGVSFSIKRGETLALVGESGSGKTTAGQCILKLLSATNGRIFFDGKDVSDLTDHQFRPFRRRIQMVFQEPYIALNPRWRVRDLLAEPFRLLSPMTSKEQASRIDELLGLVNIAASSALLYPHELTAGEQKRVGIARALATRPDFIVFDEPTTALDIRVRAQIIDLIRDLQQGMGLSALFITHDLNSVRSLANNVAVMHLGKIVESGSTEDIFARPREAYTRKLLSAELPVEDITIDRARPC